MDTPEPPTNDPEVYQFWMNVFCIIIAASEAIGGLVGAYDVLSEQSAGSSNPILGTALLFFLFAIVSGIVLAINRRWGVFPSLVVQAAQLLQFGTAGLYYRFICGPELVVGYYTSDAGTIPSWVLGLKAWLSFSAPVASVINRDAVFVSLPEGAITGLNVVALASLICLFLARRVNLSRRSASLASPVT